MGRGPQISFYWPLKGPRGRRDGWLGRATILKPRRGGPAILGPPLRNPISFGSSDTFENSPAALLCRKGLKRVRIAPGLAAMNLQETIVADLTRAMKEKDAVRLSTLRMVKAGLMNRKIEKGGELTDEEVTKALQSLVKQRRDSVEQYEKAGRSDLAANETAEIRVIEQYLPRAATEEEVRAAVEGAVSESGASSLKDMGNVMKAVMAKLQGKSVDGRAVSEAVKARLRG